MIPEIPPYFIFTMSHDSNRTQERPLGQINIATNQCIGIKYMCEGNMFHTVDM